jgi:two-component system sensor histidine kinase YesM
MKRLLQVLQFSFRTIRQKMLLSFAILIVLPSLFIYYSFYRSSLGVVEEQIYTSSRDEVQQQSREMHLLAERIVRMSNLVYNDKEFEKLLETEGDSEYEAFRKWTEIQAKLQNMLDFLLVGNAYVALLDQNGKVYSTWGNANYNNVYERFSKEPFFIQALEQNGKPLWNSDFTMSTYQGKSQFDEKLVTFTRAIEFDSSLVEDVVLFVGVPEDQFFNSPTAANSFSMVLQGDQLIWQSSEEWTMNEVYDALEHQASDLSEGRRVVKLNNQMYIVNEAVIPQNAWRLIQLTSQQESMSMLRQIKNQSISGLIIVFTVFTAFFVVLMLRFTQPIRTLLYSMNQLGKGDFTGKVNIKGSDEIAELGSRFNIMAERLHHLITSLSEEQHRKEEARFQALQAQINPHFLLNTLNSIKWMANLSGAHHVGDMITSLGALLMFNMRHDKEEVTLKDELDNLQHYLEIQKIRYHDDIVIHTEVPEELWNDHMLKFTLQPIVENSIIHGGRFPLHITITARVTEGVLTVTLADNGVGMSEEQIKQVESSMRVPHAKFSGIGIRNVSERIRMKYGAAYGVAIENGELEGIRVIVKQPVLEEGKQHD